MANKLTGLHITRLSDSEFASIIPPDICAFTVIHESIRAKMNKYPCQDMKWSNLCVLSGSSVQWVCYAGMLRNGTTCAGKKSNLVNK